MDRRIRKTKNSIRKLLLEIMETDPANRITVTEICGMLDINRSTFYSHYESIEDVLAEIEDELMDEITAKIRSNQGKDFNSVLNEVSAGISANKKIYQILVKSHTGRFTWKLSETITNLLSIENREADWKPRLKYSREYIKAFMVSGLIGLLLEWLKHDCTDTMPAVSREMQRYFSNSDV